MCLRICFSSTSTGSNLRPRSPRQAHRRLNSSGCWVPTSSTSPIRSHGTQRYLRQSAEGNIALSEGSGGSAVRSATGILCWRDTICRMSVALAKPSAIKISPKGASIWRWRSSAWTRSPWVIRPAFTITRPNGRRSLGETAASGSGNRRKRSLIASQSGIVSIRLKRLQIEIKEGLKLP